MRLGQFARKYDIRVQDIISYLDKADEEIHSNTKLSSEDETEILDFFGIEPEEEIAPVPKVEELKPEETQKEDSTVKETKIEEDEDAWIDQDEPVFEDNKEKSQIAPEINKSIPSTPEEDIALAEGELDVLPSRDSDNEISTDEDVLEETVKEEVPPVDIENKNEPKEDEIIDTERLIELLDSEEEIPELDKIKLIKAPKKELSGLKVLGKVDLPEPKKKEVKEEEEKEQNKKDKNPRSKSDDDDWEERRLKARAKRLKNEARVAKLKKEKEEKERIARNATHYKQKIGTAQPKKKKAKAKKKVVETTNTQQLPKAQQSKSKVQKEQPKSALGKMWKWLTNPDQ